MEMLIFKVNGVFRGTAYVCIYIYIYIYILCDFIEVILSDYYSHILL